MTTNQLTQLTNLFIGTPLETLELNYDLETIEDIEDLIPTFSKVNLNINYLESYKLHIIEEACIDANKLTNEEAYLLVNEITNYNELEALTDEIQNILDN